MKNADILLETLECMAGFRDPYIDDAQLGRAAEGLLPLARKLIVERDKYKQLWEDRQQLADAEANTLSEENERLEGVITRCDTEIDELISEVVDLKVRSSAAEHDVAMYHECRDQWKRQAESLSGLATQLERAEEVVEAANLAIRRYEERKE